MKSELILFGRSPFINQVDVEALCKKYTTIGLNAFASEFPVDYVFYYDEYMSGHRPTTTVVIPNWFHEPGFKYVPKPGGPLYPAMYQGNELCLGVKYFSASVAANWAIVNGYKKIYLVGIDHDETKPLLDHYNGFTCPTEILQSTHRELKSFIYQCSSHAEIYQCNPAVRDQWQLPYKDINELYET